MKTPPSILDTLHIDLSKNEKQEKFYELAMKSVKGDNSYRHLFYGGAIRGGKTYVSLALLAEFATTYPDSRWHVFRKDFPALESTTIPSFQKLIGNSEDWAWYRNRSNFHVYHKASGSKIFFKGENIDHDPDLNDLLGLETNGILFEQIEELSPKLWQMGCSRLGSWYIDPMPKPITLATLNPTQRWIKPLIYEPYSRGELKEPYFYLAALPGHNKCVTDEQWEAWSQLDDRYRAQFILGDWTDLTDRNSLWAYAFDRQKHAGKPEYDPNHVLYVSFDFNRNPICCSVIQYIDNQIRVLDTIKLSNSDIYALCTEVRKLYPDGVLQITGDASGKNGSALVRDNANFYTVIRDEFDLSRNQLQVPNSNPSLAENQMLINSILSHRDVIIHSERAKALIYDMENVRQEADGSIIKRDRRDPSQQADALDTFRYWCNTFIQSPSKQR